MSLPLDSWLATDSQHLHSHIFLYPSDSSLSLPSANLGNNGKSSMSSSDGLSMPQDSATAAALPGFCTTNNGPETLLAQASAGFGAPKVSRKRSRASTKAPITVLTADTTNFRAMVQKLTGIPGSPMALRNTYHFRDTPSAAASVLRPQASRPSQAIHELPTLDTSAFLLLDGASFLNQDTKVAHSDSFLHRLPTFSPVLQSSQPQAAGGLISGLNNFPSETASELRALFSNSFAEEGNNILTTQPWDLFEGSSLMNEIGPLSQEDMKGPASKSGYHGIFDMQQLKKRETAALENFLMSNDKVDLDSSARSLHSSSVDSRLSSKMELTYSA